ncbi:hypothetical protein OTU49_001623 [Cherax quadricarinatus]|uniref:Uncharacterized protein n=1 Tax=Cherax quadricarinatus TaxID=27406 RepID=A0AAW0XRV4_CHEQU
MFRALLILPTVVVVVAATTTTESGQTPPGCQVCPVPCQLLPQPDNSCPVCVCNGVALTDCSKDPVSCPPTCNTKFYVDGCRCVCPQKDDSVCPSLPSCPKECQQRINGSSCPVCVCKTKQRTCPPITCHKECIVEVDNNGCSRCYCERYEICPLLPACLRKCISVHENSNCFYCNCTVIQNSLHKSFNKNPFSVWPFRARPFARPFGAMPFEARPFGVRPFEFDYDYDLNPLGSESFNRYPLAAQGDMLSPSKGCHYQNFCPIGCRTALDANGCDQCFCGDDAYLCPGVPSCPSHCLFLSHEDRCYHCACPEHPFVDRVSMGGENVQNFPFNFLLPTNSFPTQGNYVPKPILPLTNTPNSNRKSACQKAPITCDPRCQLMVSSDGCQLCKCSGDLCPNISCLDHCIHDVGVNGCPICNCDNRPFQPSVNNTNDVSSTAKPIMHHIPVVNTTKPLSMSVKTTNKIP